MPKDMGFLLQRMGLPLQTEVPSPQALLPGVPPVARLRALFCLFCNQHFQPCCVLAISDILSQGSFPWKYRLREQIRPFHPTAKAVSLKSSAGGFSGPNAFKNTSEHKL